MSCIDKLHRNKVSPLSLFTRVMILTTCNNICCDCGVKMINYCAEMANNYIFL